MTNGERIVAVCEAVLEGGAMGEHERAAWYRAIISCGLDRDGGYAIATLRTSCAMFARAVHHFAGRRAKGWSPGRPMVGPHGWLGGLDFVPPVWAPYAKGMQPEAGDLFYAEHPTKPRVNHVGFFIAETAPNVWRTAEGGGGDGSRCNWSQRTIGALFGTNQLRGWWRAEALELGTAPALPTPSAPELVPGAPTPSRRTLRLAKPLMYGDDVRVVQRALGVYQDGWYGKKTELAARRWQRLRGLQPDGVWGGLSWEILDAER